ncbi:MerR family transcriptional regulator [Bacillus spizizenii]|uniref:Transcriptional regulator (MerR family) protein n=1 Tax=Bacillus spizizenii (strain ATCC 23059 / NRRL B-14472 / W23) TaxID=655816 RepID=E0TU35_BACSH|nr:MerR family transcriptional regulator [Bacillus spizizenii]QCJ18703.1 MerR family transcriptional regulator [Bacillus subtilis]ADM39641.1 transcriptional regulator (MerR family) protein [Bacillus spizizenii str. W23]AJW85104.1 MerR family transcriptional regulator [Bacillus spizizenii]EFG92284.1 transcriptional regulator (MerR family) protein [Bacillus spizizenii ATCC 6633 = JCM 2499]KFK78601.1 HTH-type transcriptional activator mta [Bacillus spizizenii]
MKYQVKQVADIAGVSIRTLHHYDDIQLLNPSALTDAGYRLYSDADLERLQQILFFREIGFRLDDIKEMLDHPNFDRKAALQSQKDMLMKKKQRMEEMIQTIDRTLQSIEGGEHMNKRDLFAGLSMKDIEEHQQTYSDEVRKLYGREIAEETEKRTSAYTSDDWRAIMAEFDSIYRRIAARMIHGPDDAEVQSAVGAFRDHICQYHYDCTLDIFRGLGEVYITDERFTNSINQYGEGLAAFLREAIIIYCDQQEKPRL